MGLHEFKFLIAFNGCKGLELKFELFHRGLVLKQGNVHKLLSPLEYQSISEQLNDSEYVDEIAKYPLDEYKVFLEEHPYFFKGVSCVEQMKDRIDIEDLDNQYTLMSHYQLFLLRKKVFGKDSALNVYSRVSSYHSLYIMSSYCYIELILDIVDDDYRQFFLINFAFMKKWVIAFSQFSDAKEKLCAFLDFLFAEKAEVVNYFFRAFIEQPEGPKLLTTIFSVTLKNADYLKLTQSLLTNYCQTSFYRCLLETKPEVLETLDISKVSSLVLWQWNIIAQYNERLEWTWFRKEFGQTHICECNAQQIINTDFDILAELPEDVRRIIILMVAKFDYVYVLLVLPLVCKKWQQIFSVDNIISCVPAAAEAVLTDLLSRGTKILKELPWKLVIADYSNLFIIFKSAIMSHQFLKIPISTINEGHYRSIMELSENHTFSSADDYCLIMERFSMSFGKAVFIPPNQFTGPELVLIYKRLVAKSVKLDIDQIETKRLLKQVIIPNMDFSENTVYNLFMSVSGVFCVKLMTSPVESIQASEKTFRFIEIWCQHNQGILRDSIAYVIQRFTPVWNVELPINDAILQFLISEIKKGPMDKFTTEFVCYIPIKQMLDALLRSQCSAVEFKIVIERVAESKSCFIGDFFREALSLALTMQTPS